MEVEIQKLIRSFYSGDGVERAKARTRLVELGKTAIDYLVGLQYSSQKQVRWEAIKTLSQIAAPESIPILINALENHDLEVRWLAAEGLVAIGTASIKPLLESLVRGRNSKFLLEGAHHVLRGLKLKHLFLDNGGVINLIEHYNLHFRIAWLAKQLLTEAEQLNTTPKIIN